MSFGIPVRNGLSISLLSTTSLSSGRGLRPSLALNFLSGTLDSRIDFTRTSSATYVDATGKIVSTPASRNLLTFTQEFDNAAWTKTSATVTGNSTTAPDGSLTADTINANAGAAGAPRVTQAPSTVGGQPYTISAYFKANGTNFAFLSLRTTSVNWAGAEFNLVTGVVNRTPSDGTVTFNSASITPVGNGWYRCSVTVTPAAVAQFVIIGSSDGSGAFAGGYPTFTNAGTETVYIWGAQLEAGSTATDYTRNFGSVYPPRFDYDPVTLAPKGLLIEEQRTNLLLRSEEFDNSVWAKGIVTITANYAASPDGTADADRFVSAGGSFPQIAQSVTVSTGDHTVSIYVKSDGTSQIQQTILFDGSSVNFTPTDTWTRVTLTKNVTVSGAKSVVIATNSASAAASSFLIWGAQLEAGAFATSYIPTVASQVTRTADVATITGANFSQWFNAAEGSFVVEFNVVSTATASKVFFTTSNGTSDNVNYGYVFNTAATFAEVRSGGATQATLAIGTATPNTTFKAATAYRANDFAAVGNGGTVQTDTSGAVPLSQTELNLGYSRNYGGLYLNGHLRSLRYYPTRLSNAQLQALTS